MEIEHVKMFGKLLLRKVEMEDLYSPNTSHSSGLHFCIFPFIVFPRVGVFPFHSCSCRDVCDFLFFSFLHLVLSKNLCVA